MERNYCFPDYSSIDKLLDIGSSVEQKKNLVNVDGFLTNLTLLKFLDRYILTLLILK